MESQLSILSESLDKKIQVLKEIQEYNSRQEKAFQQEEADMEEFDHAIEEKERLIEKLSKLDEGFETLYERLSRELEDNRDKYSEQIRDLQEKISQIMDMSVAIQAQEARNKKLVEDYFAKERQNIRQSRQASKAAYDYYRSMSATGMGQVQSRFMDSKQ